MLFWCVFKLALSYQKGLLRLVKIYRCWIIYEKSRLIVAFPIFFWLGGLMLTGLQAYGQIVQSALLLKDWQPVNRNAGGPGSILTPFWLCTIILNIYATCKLFGTPYVAADSFINERLLNAVMIVRRIYLVSKMSRISTSVDRLRFTMRVLIESGFLYLTTAIAHFVVWFTPNTYAISIISGMVHAFFFPVRNAETDIPGVSSRISQ